MTRGSNMEAILSRAPLIPVLVIEQPEWAVPLARALVQGGLPVLEVTLRTPAALEAVAAIRNEVPGALVGVGTVVQAGQFAQARDAGALFAVSPGFTEALAAAAGALPWLPGIATASEAMLAIQHGYTTLKFFPAEQAGGIPMLKALAGPFPELRFCPTGGITAASAADYLALPNVLCVGGSWLTGQARLEAGDWAGIEREARALCARLGRG
ncbi:MAG TPA: bifunctional 4-hydroxy-2-oxoglutarate aldolase/2-dehydro-3-deoxy-phosphogluconate aldolase [Candidatus Competibacteraceae bacterium]|nr:bifunctional 4-hydroxy-2-oxoglutarate aldolase/2-dehydro-3-deoxy-phosphogluconate aldolase [Candidatus Competibacteraceae bacterium]